jgi:hypothetical protein
VMLDPCAPPYNRCMAPFFNSGVDWSSVRQQGIANCPLPAILAALGRTCPREVRGMIVHDRDQPYQSTLGQRPGSGPSVFRVTFRGLGRTITISPRLHYPRPLNAQHRVAPELRNVVFAWAGDGGWVSYIEKAYVVWRGGNRYENLDVNADNAPTVDRIMFDLAGRFTKIEFDQRTIFHNQRPGDESVDCRRSSANRPCFVNVTSTRLRAILQQASTSPTIATTRPSPQKLIPEHTYVVTGLSTTGVRVQQFMNDSPPQTIRLADLHREFDAILQRAGNCLR